MSQPITSLTQNLDGSWLFTWADAGASYYRIVLWGEEIDRVTTPSYTWQSQRYATIPPPLEVMFEDQQALSEQFPPFLIMQWYFNPDTVQYAIIHYSTNTSSWSESGYQQENGEWVHTYQSPILIDGSSHMYRVIAIDQHNNQAPPRNYAIDVVCPPIPPSGTIGVTYNKPNAVVASV